MIMKKNSNIEYKVKYANDSDIPTSIVRRIVNDEEYLVESCNQYRAWIASPDSISAWIGSSDGDWFSPPDGVDKPIEFIEEWISKWKKNWTSTE